MKGEYYMNMKIDRSNKNSRSKILKILLVGLMIVAVVYLVYFTGGTKKVYVHLMYIPIILSAIFGGAINGVVIGILCGILVGPFMPMDVSLNIMQDPINWINRLLVFTLIGFITGYMIDRINKLNSERQERNLKSPFYNLPNVQKLIHDMEERIQSNQKFKLISIKLTNLNDVEKYISNIFIYDIVDNLVKELNHHCDRGAVYSYEKDELIVLVCDKCVHNYEEKIKHVLEHYVANPIDMNGIKFRVSLKVGVYVYTGEDNSPIDIYNKARIAYEQGEVKESGVYYYDVNLENKRREIHDITGAMLESIDKNELFVMYQPKIDIIHNKIAGVEALVRWKRNGKDLIGPNVFIPIAEEIGFISKISKFVFDSVTSQMNIWKSKGIHIKCAVNTSVKEMIDDDYTSWVKEIITTRNVNREDFELELTERAIAYNDKRIIEKVRYFKSLGYQISIDDFGTGYNSLKGIDQMPFDKLKIDKYFMDRIYRAEIKELVKHIIEFAHSFGIIVIAEGVETEEQLNVLKELNCDEVQGFYFSKPLLPEDFERYYTEFNRRAENGILSR